MSTYHIIAHYGTLEDPHWPHDAGTRKRKDAAALLFEKTLFNAIAGQALRDTQAGWNAYRQGQKVWAPDCTELTVTVGGTTVHFWKA